MSEPSEQEKQLTSVLLRIADEVMVAGAQPVLEAEYSVADRNYKLRIERVKP